MSAADTALKAAIDHALKWHMYDDAVLLSEVLYNEARTDENLFSMGHAYYQSGQIGRAYAVLKGNDSADCRYLFATCCYELDKLQEAEMALTGSLLESSQCRDLSESQGAAEALMAKIAKKSNRPDLSNEFLRRSHALNPFLFSVFEALCTAGKAPQGNDAFQPPSSLLRALSTIIEPIPAAAVDTENDPGTPGPGPLDLGSTAPSTPVVETPVAPPIKVREPPQAPRELRKQPQSNVRFQTPETPPKPSGVMKFFASSFNDSKRKAKTLVASFRSSTDGNTTTPSAPPFPHKRMRTALEDSVGAAMTILAGMGRVVELLSSYRCKEALAAIAQLPGLHSQTGWAFCHQGRAYFELADYKAADSAFRMAKRVEAHRVDGMAVYSTVLWHLRCETALSYLAHEVVAIDRTNPQAWCVVGNCFSLQKDHDAAVKFFQRAVQVDPTYAYAYTLLGHEYIFNEDFTKALSCFRAAIRCDPRHYNAWYGLGIIHYRQEKYAIAEGHFRSAVKINPCSPVLLCYQGMVQHAQKKSRAALDMLSKALDMDDSNALAYFHKAVVLSALDSDDEALLVLQRLRELAPRESSVYFLMGKIYKKLGQPDKAAIHLAWAMDLDPRGSHNVAKESGDLNQLTDEDIRATHAPESAESEGE